MSVALENVQHFVACILVTCYDQFRGNSLLIYLKIALVESLCASRTSVNL